MPGYWQKFTLVHPRQCSDSIDILALDTIALTVHDPQGFAVCSSNSSASIFAWIILSSSQAHKRLNW